MAISSNHLWVLPNPDSAFSSEDAALILLGFPAEMMSDAPSGPVHHPIMPTMATMPTMKRGLN